MTFPVSANCTLACSQNRGRSTFPFYYGLKFRRFPVLNCSTYNLGVTFQLCSLPGSLYPPRKPIISCNKAWKNSKRALKVHVRDSEKWGLRGRPTWKHLGLKYCKSQNIYGDPSPWRLQAERDTQTLSHSDSMVLQGSTEPSNGTEATICPDTVRKPRQGSALWSGRAPGPFSRPLLSPSPRPGLSSLLFPFFSLPPLPPRHTQNKATSPQKPTNFPVPCTLPTSQEHAETAGQEAPQDGPHLPFSRSLLSPARGGQKRGRRGAGAAAAAAGLHAHASQLARERRKKGARQGSARAAALSTAPPLPGLARRQRLLPSRRLLPRRPASPAQFLIQPLPLTQRRRDTSLPPPPLVFAKVFLRAAEPPPSAPPPGQLWKEVGGARTASAWRPRGVRPASRRELEKKGRPATHSNGIFSWAGGFGPPCGGREATSNNIGTGVVGTTFCGSAGPPPAPLFVRLPPAEPGGASNPRRLPPGPGVMGPGGLGEAELQVHARGATWIPTRGDERSLQGWARRF